MSQIAHITTKELFELIGKEVNLNVEIDRFVEIRTPKAILNFNTASCYAHIEMLDSDKEYRFKITN